MGTLILVKGYCGGVVVIKINPGDIISWEIRIKALSFQKSEIKSRPR
jgi:hypothetical protein